MKQYTLIIFRYDEDGRMVITNLVEYDNHAKGIHHAITAADKKIIGGGKRFAGMDRIHHCGWFADMFMDGGVIFSESDSPMIKSRQNAIDRYKKALQEEQQNLMDDEAIDKINAELDAEEKLIDELSQPPVIAKLCYFNQHWNVYLHSKDEKGYECWIKEPSLKTVASKTGEYRLREYKHPDGVPVFSFGHMLNDENARYRPGHGGEWSSNAKHINGVFGTDLIEVALDGMAVAVPLPWLKQLLGDLVVWGKDDIYIEEILSVKDHKNSDMKWIELDLSKANSGTKAPII